MPLENPWSDSQHWQPCRVYQEDEPMDTTGWVINITGLYFNFVFKLNYCCIGGWMGASVYSALCHCTISPALFFWFILRQGLTTLPRLALNSLDRPWTSHFPASGFQAAKITGLLHQTQPNTCVKSSIQLELALVNCGVSFLLNNKWALHHLLHNGSFLSSMNSWKYSWSPFPECLSSVRYFNISCNGPVHVLGDPESEIPFSLG